MDLKTQTDTPTAGPGTSPPVLRLTAITKTFPGVRALRGVSLEAVPGEVHALLGENGPGKPTWRAVAAGAIAPDAGTIELGGETYGAIPPIVAQERGLAIV